MTVNYDLYRCPCHVITVVRYVTELEWYLSMQYVKQQLCHVVSYVNRKLGSVIFCC